MKNETNRPIQTKWKLGMYFFVLFFKLTDYSSPDIRVGFSEFLKKMQVFKVNGVCMSVCVGVCVCVGSGTCNCVLGS